MARLAIPAAVLLGATALVAACSVYDESLLGAGGTADTTTSGKTSGGDGGSGDGGATATSSSTATTASSSPTSTGQTGTVTTGSECETPDDCPGVDSECSVRACEGNACSVSNMEQGFLLARQVAGDCVIQICDGAGNVVSDADDSDVPTQEDDCIVPVCLNGFLDTEDAEIRTPCGTDFLCDGTGICVECIDDGDCPENCSAANTCVQAQCDDNSKNGQETDVDCGGLTCDPCVNGLDCSIDGDCVSGDCAGTCQPSCSDGVLGAGEADVDCGGICPTQCILGSACGDNNDCDSDTCIGTVCRPGLFFSEYVEGEAAANKAVEIFNYGNVPLDLTAAACVVKPYFNGSSTPNPAGGIVLTGTIAEFGTHVLCNSNFVPACSSQPPSGSLSFNGDDTLVLECGGVVLDVFGQVGVDPGTAWAASTSNSTANNTLRRNGGVTAGDRVGNDAFVPSAEWTGVGADVYSGLGDHP